MVIGASPAAGPPSACPRSTDVPVFTGWGGWSRETNGHPSAIHIVILPKMLR
ncbi:hypothetical protein TPY_2186 [Sulfobacillus acidophilus TPY]|nr:hypothetical protein TPY_2186 [Sulfobacillus acidophilus TPY]